MIGPVDIAALNLLTGLDDVVMYINTLMQVERPEDNEEKFWFATPENSGNESEHSPIHKRILFELRDLAELEKLDLKENEESRTKFLSMSKRTNSIITVEDCENLESTIVESNDIFARDRLDIGMSTQFKVSLTPKDDKLVSTQSLPVPKNLLIVDNKVRPDSRINPQAPLPNHHDATFLQMCSPSSAQRKPNGKLRLLVDLRKINALNGDD